MFTYIVHHPFRQGFRVLKQINGVFITYFVIWCRYLTQQICWQPKCFHDFRRPRPQTYSKRPYCNCNILWRYYDKPLKELENWTRYKVEFQRIFEKAESVAEFVLSINVDVPRQATRQTKRDNLLHNSPVEYYKRRLSTLKPDLTKIVSFCYP